MTSLTAKPNIGWFGLSTASTLFLLPLLALVVGVNGPPITVPAMPSHALTSIFLAVGGAFGAALIGIPLAVALRSLRPGTAFVAIAVLCLPLAIPGYVHAIAWSAWLGLAPAGISDLRSGASVPGSIACLWVWSVTWAPLVMLTTYASLASWSRAWSEAASTSGIPPGRQVILRLRHMAPMAGSGILLVAVMVFADFPVADFFSVGTYATSVFVQLSAYADVAGAVRASLPAVVFTAVMAVCLSVSWNRAERIRQAEPRIPVSKLPSASHAAGLIAAIVVGVGVFFLVVVPIASLAAMISSPDDLVAAGEVLLQESAPSLGLAVVATAIVAVLAISGGHALARRTIRGSVAIRGVVLGTLAVPTALIGLGAIQLWNRPGPMGAIYVTGIALVLALAARFWPIGVELAARSWSRLPQSWEEAAYVAGRPPRAMLLRIAAPQLWRFWVGAALFVFILVLNELTLLTLLAPPGFSTISLRIFSSVHYGPASLLAALCLGQVVVVASMYALAWTLMRRRQANGAEC